MPRDRLSREEKRALTRADILDAAATIFPRRGYHQASVDEIAAEAGLSTGAVYSNFESKAELFLALYERHMERHAAELEQLVTGGETPAAQIEGAGRHWLEFVRRDRDWLLLDVEFSDRYAAAYRRLRDTAARLVEQAAATFGTSLPATPRELGTILSALGTGLMFEKLADPEHVSDELFESALSLILAAAASGGADDRGQPG
jgi:AcrR family transcriptional regulator